MTSNANESTPKDVQPSSVASAAEVSSISPKIPASRVWNHYTKIIPPDGSKPVKCKCNYCYKVLGCASIHGTSSLKRHLERCFQCPISENDKRQKTLNVTIEKNDGKTTTSLLAWKFDLEFCRRKLCQMIIKDELPFKFVEREGFREFCNALQPKWNPLSRNTVAKDCLELYVEEKRKLKEMFKKTAQRVCITTDMWTSIQNLGYLCLTAHYIDQDWKLQKRIINFCVVPSPHTGEVIGNTLEMCLNDWNLEILCTITVDNACNNDVAIRNLKRRFSKKNGLLLEGEFFHMRCSAHVLNLIVKTGLEYCGDATSRVRSAVRYVKSSPARSQQFRVCCELEKIESKRTLCLDVHTRWNSTYLMLQTALEFQKAFECLDDRDKSFSSDCKDGIPTIQEWEKAKVLANVLESFYNATTKLSGSSYVTANLYFKEVYLIESMLSNWKRSDNDIIRDMSLAMMEKFNKYWGSVDKVNIILVVARVLDPRYKLKYVRFCYSRTYAETEVEVKTERVRNVMDRLLKYYQAQGSTHSASSVDGALIPFDAQKTDDRESLDRDFHYVLQEEARFHVESELDHYLLEGFEVDDNAFDLLARWKINSSRFVFLK